MAGLKIADVCASHVPLQLPKGAVLICADCACAKHWHQCLCILMEKSMTQFCLFKMFGKVFEISIVSLSALAFPSAMNPGSEE